MIVSGMTSDYRVSVKDSVFRKTGLSRNEYEESVLTFDSKADAQAWIDEQNDLFSVPGGLTLHTAHPNDNSGVDAYLVFRESGVWTVDE